MDQRTEYLVQIMEKIGAPLVAALRNGERKADPKADAQAVAQMLSSSVQMSIDIGKAMKLNMSDPDQSDRFRLALMGLSGPLVAGHFSNKGAVPSDDDKKSLLAGLGAVLSFSDNFGASAQNIAALKEQDEKPDPSAMEQLMIRSVHIFVPVIQAHAAHPAGKDLKAGLEETARALIADSKEFSEALPLDLTSGDAGLYKLMVTQMLADLYAQAHKDSAAEKPENIQERAWEIYNLRRGMLASLIENLIPGSKPVGGAAAQQPAQPENQQAQPQQPPPPSAPEQPQASPQDTSGEQQGDGGQDGNQQGGGQSPLSMFAKKKPEEGSGGSAPPADQQPAAPPAGEGSQDQPPQDTGTGQDSDQSGESGGDAEKGEEDKGGDSGGGSPMSFFKKKE